MPAAHFEHAERSPADGEAPVTQPDLLQGFRLSPQQQHLWQVRRPEIPWVVQCAVEIAGALDREWLRLVLGEVAARHEILRTTLPVPAMMNLPLQAIDEPREVTVPLAGWQGPEWAGLDPDERRERLEGLLAARATAFDLGRGPLFRVELLEIAPALHLLLLTLSVFIADPATARLLAAEVAAAYAGTAHPAEPLQYADAAEALHEWLGSRPSGETSFWERQDLSVLCRAPAPPAAAAAPAALGMARLRLGAEPSRRIALLAGALGAPLPQLLLAVWHATLHLSTGEAEIAVATSFDGRTCAEFETALGPFARALPLRTRIAPDTTFRTLLAALQQSVAEVRAWQDSYPFAIVDALLAEGGAAPGWRFGFDHRPPFAALPGGASGAIFRIAHERARSEPFELLLVIEELDRELAARLVYAATGRTGQDAQELLGRFARLLDELAAMGDAPHADTPLAEIDVLSQAERARLLVEFNAGGGAGDRRTTTELFAEQVRRAPRATAIVAGDLRLTYAELNTAANRLAHRLRALGVGPGSLVGLCLERSPDMVVGLLGVLKTGAAYVPFDPAYPPARLAFMAEDSRISALLCADGAAPGPLRAALPPATRVLALDARAEELSRRDAEDPPPVAGPDDLAYVIYTSGSTGRPKGVMVPHRGLVNYLLWARQTYGPWQGRGAPVHSTLGFDLTVTSVLVPLVAGAAITLLPEERGIGALAAALRGASGFDLVKLTPAHLEVLRELLPGEACRGAAGALVIGGEALRTESLALWREHAAATRLINEYGPTEATVGCCTYEVRTADAAAGPVPIGRPIANTRLYVVGTGLQPVPAGAPGELWIGGDGLARGYLGRPDLTAERFVPDPFGPQAGARLYRTGDLVRHGTGVGLEFLGRIDDQVKLRGFRIEPGEIEAALAAHAAVREAAVAARDAAGGKRLVAYVVPAAGRRLDAALLRRFLGEKLPAHMVPEVFVALASLPLTSHGKVDRRALPEPSAAGQADTAHGAPRTLAEELLAEIWARVLGLPRVGIDDRFFSLGGDSIRTIQVLSLARERGLALTLQDLFAAPTIRTLAERARFTEQAGEDEAAALPPFALLSEAERQRLPAGLEDAYPLARLQAGMVFHSLLGAGSAIYHDLHSFHLRGHLDAGLLRTTIDRAVARHALLRTSFDLATFNRPLQLVHTRATPPVSIEDLRRLPQAAQEQAVRAWLTGERQRGFAWDRPPLLRFHVQLRSEDSFQFTLSFHHSVLDGWSAASLLSELFRRYAALREGLRAAEPPPPAVSFSDFVELERRALASEPTRDYWRRQLAGAPAARLPRDRRPTTSRQRAQSLSLPVDPEVIEGLRRVAHDLALPLKSVLLAAHVKAVGFLTGQSDVVTGLISNGRPERQDGDQVLGLFLNTLPLRLPLGGETWRELARRAFECEREMLPHRRFPLAEIQAQQQGVPPFEVSFNFLHYHVYQSLQEIGDLEVTDAYSYEEINFPLAVSFYVPPSGAGMAVLLNVQEAEIAPAQGHEMGGVFLRTLAALAAAPAERHEHAALLLPAERHQLLCEWGEGRCAPLPALCVQELFEAQALRTPHAVALASGEARLTYAALDARANRLAHRLRALGIGPESLVGIALERCPLMVEALLAVLKSGAAYVPFDSSHPAEHTTFLAADSRISLLLGTAGVRERWPDLAVPILLLDSLEESTALALQSARPLPRRGLPENAAYVLYTSGSTGRPKGVVVPHLGLVNRLLCAQQAFRLGAADAVLQQAPLTFDFSFWEIFAPLIAGSRTVLARPGGHRDPAYLARLIAAEAVTIVHFVPSMLEMFLRLDEGERHPSLRLLFCGGEALTRALRERCFARFATPIENQYGPTEASIDVVWSSFRPGEPVAGGAVIGRPIANCAAYLLDSRLRPVPAGAPAEIHLGGVCLARGYAGKPDLTAERFVPHPFAAGERLYRTGDVARHLPDGTLDYLGRADDQVKVRGIRIELAEIEAALVSCPGVREAAVAPHGEGAERRLVAYVVTSPEAGASIPELRRALRQRLPEALVPGAWMELPALPLSPSGKIDRRALPDPEAASPAAGEVYVEPGTEIERTVAAVWRDVLHLERIGRDDNFFDLGGHSLLLIQVQARLRATLGRPVEMVDLFRYPTVRALAASLATPQPPAATAERTRPAPRRRRAVDWAAEDRVAVVGMAGRFPGAASYDELWNNLRQGVESITFLSDEELAVAGVDAALRSHPRYVAAGGFLDGVELFDADFFGFIPRDAEITDPQHRLFLECAWQALEDAGHDPAACRRVGVFAGVSTSRYLWNVYSHPELVRLVGPYKLALANDKDHVATLVSYKLDLRGPSLDVQTACSTSLVAVHLACSSLLAGECDMALAGGASIALPQRAGYVYQQGGIRSPDGHCRAFDARAAGMVGGSGAGAVVLKRLADALDDGDAIRAVVLGSAINNDGSGKVGYTAPSVEGQAEVIGEALAAAGIGARSIGYVEAHGTATPLGDPIEVAALTQAFRAAGGEGAFCALGSIKTNIGHLDAAAGVAGLIKTVLALERRELPPSLHFVTPNPQIDFASSPFYVNTRRQEWRDGPEPRRAGVSSFGIGGTNAHVVLEQAPPAAAADGGGKPDRQLHLLVLSARTTTCLDSAAENLRRHLAARPGLSLADAAFTLQTGRRAFSQRRALLCRGTAEAVELLAGAADAGRLSSGTAGSEEPAVVFLFPGQGSQHADMGRSLYESEPVFRAQMDRAGEILRPHLGADLREILYPDTADPEEKDRRLARLDDTAIAQPAIFAVEYSLARLWMSWGVRPGAMLGHSVGEYVAACLAEVLGFEDALGLVAARGRLVARLPRGAMASLPLAEGEAAALLADGLALAAVNGPQRCVVSGPEAAVQTLLDQLAKRRLRGQRLRTSHAFHSAMMDPALAAFGDLVGKTRLSPPRLPYVSNLTGSWITASEATDPAHWVRHLRATVRFADGLRTLLARSWRPLLLEVGPGHTLASLARRHPDRAAAVAILTSLPRPGEPRDDAASMLACLGSLWTAGAPVDWVGFHAAHARRRRVALPTYPFERRRYWIAEARPVAGLPAGERREISRGQPSAADPGLAPLAGNGSGASLAEHLAGIGEAFDDALASGACQVLAERIDLLDGLRQATSGAAGEPRGQGAPEPVRPRLPADYVAPADELEQQIAAVWQEVFGIAPIGVGDDFFALGGDSLTALQLASRLTRLFGVELPARSLFDNPTITGLTAALEREILATAEPAEIDLTLADLERSQQ